MIPCNNLEHAEAEAFSKMIVKVVGKYYTGQARVQTSATIGKNEELVMEVRMTPVPPSKGPNLRIYVQIVWEDENPPESWKGA